MALLLGPYRYFGETSVRRVVGGLALTETVHQHPTRLPRHTHEQPYFCLVLRGSFDESLHGSLREARPGTLLFHPRGETHADRIRSPGTVLLNIAFGAAWERRLEQTDERRRPNPGLQNAAAARFARRVAGELRAGDPISGLAIEGLVLTLLAEAGRWPSLRSGCAPRWLPVAFDFIRGHFRSHFDHEALARVAGVHPTHLARAFHEHTGRTVSEHVRRLRVDWACRRLARSDDAIVDVALDAGFSDHAHFTRVFHRDVGLTPSAYRRRSRASRC